MARKLADGNLIRSLLKLDDLLVDELAALMDHEIGVHWAFL